MEQEWDELPEPLHHPRLEKNFEAPDPTFPTFSLCRNQLRLCVNKEICIKEKDG